jgi:hypothetical protein
MPVKNQPAFDLEAELKRVLGVDLTRMDGIKVMTAHGVRGAGTRFERRVPQRGGFQFLAHAGTQEGCKRR